MGGKVRWIAALGLLSALGLAGIVASSHALWAAQEKGRPAKAGHRADPAPARTTEIPPPPVEDLPPSDPIPVPPPSNIPPEPGFAAPPLPGEALPPPQPATPGDPEQAAEKFITRTRKEASDQVAALTKEAEALRDRLKRVEAALATYRSTLEALKASAERAEALTSRAQRIEPDRADDIDLTPAPMPVEAVRPLPGPEIDPMPTVVTPK